MLKNEYRYPIWGVLIVLMLGSTLLASDNLEIAAQLYQNGQFSHALRLAQKDKQHQPLGRLIVSLCQIHDKHNQNLRAGLDGLRALYLDQTIKVDAPPIWAEAALSYGRVVQVLQVRKRHPEYAQVDISKVYREIILTLPEDARACTAAIYIAEVYFSSNNPLKQKEGFGFLESFIKKYEGNQANLTPLHVYLEGCYINLKNDYASSFKHLRSAYEAGIHKEILARVTLFRLGRICDIKLNKKTQAKAYYKEFLRQFPDDQRSSVARRYLKELKGS